MNAAPSRDQETDAVVCWFTGLSGAGKSTISNGVASSLRAQGHKVLVLDGDVVRTTLHRHLGFSEAEIRENNRLIANLCAENRKRYQLILVPIISPYAQSRSEAQALLEKDFVLVYCNASIDAVAARDVKGLYAKAKAGDIDNLIGYSPSAKYEPPSCPDIVIDTDNETVDQSIERLLIYLRRRFPRITSRAAT